MRSRPTPVLLVTTGLLFALYSALRPYSTEIGTGGAEAFASPLWLAAHVAAMVGFTCLVFVARQARVGALVDTTILLGVALVLPYYGAETFALHAVGQDALDTGRADLLELADPIRYGLLQVSMFGVGLILIAAGAVVLAVRTGGVGAAVFAAGFVLFLPQFYAPPWIRVAHGLLVLIGAVLFARRTATGTDAGASSGDPQSVEGHVSDAR
ncbi:MULTISPECIES: hypothetical protein [Nocardiaceae]|uniref:DUF4386 family protein n=1 Tax=Rhodococcoides corynebacterioides TaxID=53972 RepID=A0ABS2KU99_9NOCA|nr:MULTISPECIES: hypothetical protein [Rhodococcus]MBM7415517.1 hypothetical protein [Rhodococcus corynebacterioides]MBP1117979.1 hypothetical protein [Rhodococcus sp. PvP016]